MKTLIADDERPVRIAISKLGQWGKYHLEQPVQVENGQEALSAMYELKPAIVFVDIQMPVMNGYEAAQAIRSSTHPQSATIPIIAMTANAFAEDVNISLQSGMNAHLTKPIEPAVFYSTLYKYFKK